MIENIWTLTSSSEVNGARSPKKVTALPKTMMIMYPKFEANQICSFWDLEHTNCGGKVKNNKNKKNHCKNNSGSNHYVVDH